jgi:CRP-like cAMP-binding protein
MADFLDEKRREMQARLKELRPLVDEFHRLEAAVSALDGVGNDPAPAPAPRRKSKASTGASPASSGSSNGRRGRPRGSGTRGKQALELVKGNPGITIPEIAGKMGIQQNYLYRVLPGLQKEGLIRKEGRGWHAMEA